MSQRRARFPAMNCANFREITRLQTCAGKAKEPKTSRTRTAGLTEQTRAPVRFLPRTSNRSGLIVCFAHHEGGSTLETSGRACAAAWLQMALTRKQTITSLKGSQRSLYLRGIRIGSFTKLERRNTPSITCKTSHPAEAGCRRSGYR